MVFPEGARGTAKLYKERYSLVHFGTGFVRLAMKMKTPIVPFAFLGGGEAIPTISNAVSIGKLLGVPYIPVTPWLFAVPIPAKLEVYYSEPMFFEGTGSEEDEVVLRLRRAGEGAHRRRSSTSATPSSRRAAASRRRARHEGPRSRHLAVVSARCSPSGSSSSVTTSSASIAARSATRRPASRCTRSTSASAPPRTCSARVRPHAVIHMATVTHLVVQSEDRYRINLGGTRAVFEHSQHVRRRARHLRRPPHVLRRRRRLAALPQRGRAADGRSRRSPSSPISSPPISTPARRCGAIRASRRPCCASSTRSARPATARSPRSSAARACRRCSASIRSSSSCTSSDVVSALCIALDKRPRGVFNVAGPQPVPLSMVIRETGRTNIPIPEMVFAMMLGRFGLPKLPTARSSTSSIRSPSTAARSRRRRASSTRSTRRARCARTATRFRVPRT